MKPHDPDVLVVGGGPAGSTVATLLARRGWDVLVVDRARFPRPKACGECVNPGAVEALGRLGLLADVLALEPAWLYGWRVRAPGADARARFGDGVHGLGVPRSDLDAALLDAARRAGARVREGARVAAVERAVAPGARPAVELAGGESGGPLRPRLVVGADGLRSVVTRSLGLLARGPRLRKLSLTVHVEGDGLPDAHGLLDVADGITLGVAPVGRGRWNVTVVASTPDGSRRAASDPIGFIADTLRARAPSARWRTVAGPWASGPFDWPVRRCWADGVLLVGDAAGYFDPLTGQGIYRALRSAELAAEAAHAVLASPRPGWAPLAAYHRRWTGEVRWSRLVQRGVEGAMTRPRLRGPVLRRLAATGGLARVIRVTGDAASPASLLLPSVWAGGRRRDGAARAG